MNKFDYLGNIQYIDELYADYLKNPDNIDESWKKFFQGFEFARTNFKQTNAGSELLNDEFKVLNLINAYRKRGHLFTKTNPVHPRRQYLPDLDISNFSLTENDLNKTFHAGNEIGIGNSTLRTIIEHLEQTYCQSVGAEFVYIRQPEIVDWLTKKMELCKNQIEFNKEQKLDIFKILVKAVGFEHFLHKKFVGQKRFSLEGAESLIPALGYAIEHGVEMGIKEFIVGNSHRGRLNVLANVFKKPFHSIFSEYIGKSYDDENILGDVKYHLSYDTRIKSRSGKEMFLALLPNPSHLETVGPVTQGLARTRIEHEYDNDYNKVCPIVIHGDAAVAAQGIVYETTQMSQLDGYKTGGTLHFVVNNQVGFTTNYIDARSSTYCTDIAKVTLSPVFHVNGDDVEAVLYTIQLALEYREKFHSDVFVDLLCYRKYGHNEGDEPRFTQPILYKEIASHPNVRDLYSKYLIEIGVITKDNVEKAISTFNNKLEDQLALSKQSEKVEIKHFLHDKWGSYRFSNANDFLNSPQTGVDIEKLKFIAEKINYLPTEKKFFNKIEKIVNDRKKLISENKVDWALAELLAYGSLVNENHSVRISGQDSERGTFSHRHSTFHVDDTDEKWCPLKNVSTNQAKFQIYNSLLSEYAVMGFEYGYAMGTPNGLTIWEAQFGDFHNVAQVIIDQYLSSAEDKWGLMNGLVLFLPHGFEGQGPEHSSARIERFLVLAANNNMQIVNCSTPANIFHAIRRQIYTEYRKPLIVFTPKSLLRHPLCVSTINELADGQFNEVIDDSVNDKSNIEQVVICSGKIYYEIFSEKQKINDEHTAIVRLEQYFPFPLQKIKEIIAQYPNSKKTLWVQEEPANMGAWPFIKTHFEELNLFTVCRPESGSPASGLLEVHKLRQQKILDKIFKRCNCENTDVYCTMSCTKDMLSNKLI